MKVLFLALLVLHGAVHLMGPAKAFGWAELPELTLTVTRGEGWVWLGAGLAFFVTALMVVAAPRYWWISGLLAVGLSQGLVVTAWVDARFGTIPNVLILAGVVYGFAAHGPLGLRARYDNLIGTRDTAAVESGVVEEADVSELPEPLQRYLRVSGAVGRPRVHRFEVELRGRIRAGPDEAWMTFSSEQTNFVDEPARFFLMRAVRGGLPVDILHVYADGSASMSGRLASLLPILDRSGPEMDRAETVTLFNDLSLFAPESLVRHPSLRWEQIDDRSVRGFFTAGPHEVEAVLTFDDAGRLVDFVSEDRLRDTPDGFERLRWSTPVSAHAEFDGRRVISRAEGWWHPPGGAFAYVELEVVDVRVGDGRGR